jgi:hypothetical protein
MGGRVPINLQSLGILCGEDLELGVAVKRPGEIEKLSIDARDYSV